MPRMINALLNPQRAALKIWKMLGTASLSSRLQYDLFDRPHYAYCLANAARLAQSLSVPRISAIEFGVAGGRGLLALEELCPEIEKAYGVQIEIWGFDTGEGLPDPVDYRDLPYIWKSGFYRMDHSALEAKLTRARLVLGDVKDTVPDFFDSHTPAPLGAAFFDLDFWSSTYDSFGIFSAKPEFLLPRIHCYCDDVISSEGGGILSEDVGQLRAIADYNDTSKMRKLRRIAGLADKRPIRAVWPSQIYVHHAFDHPDYTTYIHDDKNRQLAI
ncbi:hypothetical protein [Roseovarius sp.]|uniref:hypothetical protein n=1 Tax=Roseovarius sp. TaxID=1486281 RepID=UPI003D0AD11A